MITKICTDIDQSKKLAEILPLESADMHYSKDFDGSWFVDLTEYTSVKIPKYVVNIEEHLLPCWSLAALLDVIRNNGRYELQMYEGGYYFEANGFMTESYFNPIDACYEMIIKLHEQKLL